MQKHRISTDIGKDQLVTVEIKQDFDLLEILSLKFTQKEIYTSLCSDYGVVCGRISVNNGFGIPNAKISIFVPLSDIDSNDPVISTLYPYKLTNDKDSSNYRYNLLPSRQQHGGHNPTGTFPDQSDVLNREEILEVFEKYYKYTVKTNDSGDFMIWGVPVGQQTLHIDVDLSDIGCFSLRPYDFIRQGEGVDKFLNAYKFKSSVDLDSLPQVVSTDKTIEVYPFWGNTDICQIGITRSDFDLSSMGVKVEPKAFLIGGTMTDTGKNSLNKNCTPRKKMGRKCDLTTRAGKIEAIRFTSLKDTNHRPILENYDLHEDIDETGSFVAPLPMNMDFIYTNEFGENEYTNDPNRGIATSACYRLRVSLSDAGLDRTRANADYLIPNIREYNDNGVIDDGSYAFSTNYDDYSPHAVSDLILVTNNGFYYPQDYFYRFSYNKVFTVSSFQGSYFPGTTFKKDLFLGIKELSPSEEEDCSGTFNTPPINFGVKNYTFTLLIADVLLFIEHLFNLVVLLFFNTISKLFHEIGDFFDGIGFLGIHPFHGVAKFFHRIGYAMQDSGQKQLSLITYPDCVDCIEETSQYGKGSSGSTVVSLCQVGDLEIQGSNQTTFTYSATTPSTSWTVNHNLGDLYPTVQVYDLSNNLISPGNIDFVSPTTILITFSIPEAGYATATLANQTVRRRYISSITYSIPSDGQCTTIATPISNNLDFVARQTSYSLSVNGNIITLQSPSTNGDYFAIESGSLIFYDGEGTFADNQLYDVLILDNSHSGTPISGQTVQLDSGCALYDITYNTTITKEYYLAPNRTPSPTYNPLGGDIVQSSLLSDESSYVLPTNYNGTTYNPITPSGLCEFSEGIFNIIPGNLSNGRLIDILKEYRIRKRVGKFFCGGIVNYAFIDNWLSGALYFFQFKQKGGKYCGDVVHYVQGQQRYYYKSTKFINSTKTWGTNYNGNHIRLNHPTTFVDLGPRDEFIKEICTDPSLDPNCSVARSIGPTSYQDFGDIMGLIINYRLEVNSDGYDINSFFSNGGFTSSGADYPLNGDILQLISINNEAGIEEFSLQNPKYLGYSYEELQPRYFPQVFKQGSVWGPTPITFYLNEDGERIRGCLNQPGNLTESSQPVPFFLWDKKGRGFGSYTNGMVSNQSWDYTSSGLQIQPLQGMTYGYSFVGGSNLDIDQYLLLPMTYNFTGQTLSLNVTNEVDFDVIEITDDHLIYNEKYPGFTYLYVSSGTTTNPYSGTLYTRYGSAGIWYSQHWDYTDDFIIRRTQDYYNTNKQILSTPFQFFFGLQHGKTGIDKFIDLFGPKGAFPNVN